MQIPFEVRDPQHPIVGNMLKSDKLIGNLPFSQGQMEKNKNNFLV